MRTSTTSATRSPTTSPTAIAPSSRRRARRSTQPRTAIAARTSRRSDRRSPSTATSAPRGGSPGGDVPNGDRLELRLHTPVRTDGITLVQPLDADRVITKVRVRLDGGAPIDVALGDALADRGRSADHVPGPACATHRRRASRGQRGTERERRLRRGPPRRGRTRDAARRRGRAGAVAIARAARARPRPVATSASCSPGPRTDPAQHGRTDEELALVRRFELPSSAGAERGFTLSGVARLDPNAPDATLDIASGTTTPGVEYRASGHRAGDARARASRAFDGSAATAWDAPFGEQVGQWVEADLAQPTSVEGATIAVVADGRHSVPTKIRVEADGVPVTQRRRPADRRRRERRGDPSGPVPVRPGDRESAAVRRRVGAGGAHSRRSHARTTSGAGRDRRARRHGSPACSRHRRRAHDVSRRPAPHRRRADRGAAAGGRDARAVRRAAHARGGEPCPAQRRRPRHRDRHRSGGADIGRGRSRGAARRVPLVGRTRRRARARRRIGSDDVRPAGAQRREAVLAGARAEPQRGLEGGGERLQGCRRVARRTAPRQRLRERVARRPGRVGHLHDPPEVDAAEPRVGRVRGIRARDPRVSRRRVRHAPPCDSRCRGDAGADVTDALRGRVAVVAGIAS